MIDEEMILNAARETIAGVIAVTPTVKVREVSDCLEGYSKIAIVRVLLRHPELFTPVYHERNGKRRIIRYFKYLGVRP